MLRCLIRVRSVSMSSLWLIVLPSSTLTSIRTYGKTREPSRVDSSSTNPSRFKGSGSHIAGDASTDGNTSSNGDASSVVVSTVVACEQSALEDPAVRWLDGSTDAGGTAVSLQPADGSTATAALSRELAMPTLRRAAMLSLFLLARPSVVW